MLKKLKPKGLKRADLRQQFTLRHQRAEGAQAFTVHICLALISALCCAATLADTVYRCGDAYSASNQCASATATEVKPSSVLHGMGQNKSNVAASELRDAQALEKQRLQAQRQAAQTPPVRFSTPNAPPPIATNSANLGPNGKHKGNHARKLPSPYFTAVDPNAAPKKKSTAKAVPANNP